MIVLTETLAGILAKLADLLVWLLDMLQKLNNDISITRMKFTNVLPYRKASRG